MAKYIDLENATKEQLVEYLIDYWHVKSLKFEGDFVPSKSNESTVSGAFTNIKSFDTHRSISYYPPMIRGKQDVLFFVPKNKSLKSGHYAFECELAADSLRNEKENPFLLKLRLNTIKPVVTAPRKLGSKTETGKNREYSKDEILVKKNLKLKDDFFIGKFHCNPDGQYSISDIRRSDFSKLILQDGEQIRDLLFRPTLLSIPEDDCYYEFTWILKNVNHEEHKYNFTIDQKQSIKRITPKNVIDRLHQAIIDSPAGSGDRDVKMIETLKSQLTASGKEIFIYELLQNANDYPQKADGKIVPVKVEFHIMNEYLVFMHSGAEFNERNIAAICNINDKEKSDNPNAIGYKGIGFKTVFVVSNNVYLSTGPYHFRFDESFTKDMVATAYQLLPIWTNPNTLGREVVDLFSSKKELYNVQFALKPITDDILRDSSQNFVKLFNEVFENERVILFIPNIESVKVYFHDSQIPDIVRRKDSDNWVVSSYVEPISESLRNSINQEIEDQEKNGTMKIPTKYKDFMKTQVSFACAREGVMLKKVVNSILYCYLPAKDASWGFDFLLNTDMIPTGPRNDIEYDLEVNKEIASIAGKKFFDWILGLCKSKLYKTDSVFSLIPDFESCKTGRSVGHQNLITKFQMNFEERLLSEGIVPASNGTYSKVSKTILDETELSSSGIMSDEDFVLFTNLDGNLPISILRRNSVFNTFLRRYLYKFDATTNIWSKTNLKESVTQESFSKWLQNGDNNNRFISFLLDKKWLSYFADACIFLASDGKLHTAKGVYHDDDIFNKLAYIKCFENFIPHLTDGTINYFKDNSDWKTQTAEIFTILDCKSFVLNCLLNSENKNNTIELLKTKNNSLNFYSFLAKYVSLYKENSTNIDTDTRNMLKSLPFFGFCHSKDMEDVEIAYDKFEGFVLVHSDKAISFVERSWVNNCWITFVSKDYTEEVVTYLKSFYGVKEYSANFAVDTFIRPTYKTVNTGWTSHEERVSPKHLVEINNSIQNFSSSLDFFSFCYSNKELFGPKELCEYCLHVYNGDDEECYMDKSVNRFVDTGLFNVYSQKAWVEKGWLYKIDNAYFDGLDEEQSKICKKFLRECFGVYEMTEAIACHLVIKNNLLAIIKKTSIPDPNETKDEDASDLNEYNQIVDNIVNLNVDFIKFVDSKLEYFRDKETNALPEKFKDIVLNDGKNNIKVSSQTYFPDSDLENIVNMSWFPSKIKIEIVNKDYGQLDLLTSLGVRIYTFASFFDAVICTHPQTIGTYIKDFDKNKEFHAFIASRVSSIAPDKLSDLSKFPVYIIGSDSQQDAGESNIEVIPATVSSSLSNHKILSSTVTDLFEKKLVKASDLNIIHPDYRPDENFEEYWSKFGNVRFESSHFVDWLFSHKQTFSSTVSKTSENIKFWRWAKVNIADHERLGELNFLPVIVLPLPSEPSSTDVVNDTQDTFKTLTNTIYASNHYMANEDIESFVKLNDKNALFISDKYLTNQETPETIAAWMEFWKKVGVKNDYLSIIIKTIIPKLSSIKNENLPNLFAQYEAELRKQYSNLPSTLSSMLVKTADGVYRKLSSTVYVNTNTVEPFPYISIPNSISFVGKEHNVSALMLQIATAANTTIVNTPLDWRKAKLKSYAELQTIKEKVDNSLSNSNIVVTEEEKASVASFDPIHFALLKDLASIKANKNDSITDLESSISSLKLYSSAGILTLPKSLTASSVYNPLCDYQLCGITEGITYISDKYVDIDNISSLIDGTLRVRSGFSENEISLLEKYPKFARYFWETFLAKNIAGYSNAQKTILGYFRDGKFSTVACIPTEKSVMKPEDLYYGKDVDEFVDRLPNYKEKIPAVADIVFEENGLKVSLFGLLPFKSDKLNLQDCFDALICYNDQKRRPKLLSWIVAQFNKQDAKHIAIRDSYRNNPDAKWISGDNDTKRIDELYALDEPNGKLSFYFGSHPKVFNANYFPKGEDYLKVCDYLAIRVIHDNTADMETVHVKSIKPDLTEDSLKQYLQMAVLILAGIESAPDWEPAYNAYFEEISKMKFVCCESIILRYKNDNSISTDSKRFYHQSGTDIFMYVDSYKDPRLFTDFVGELMLCLKIKADKDIVLNLLYDKKSALAEIEKRNQLKSDEKFMQFMEAYDSGISSRFKGRKADETPIEAKIEHKTIEVKDQVPNTPIEHEDTSHEENKNNSHEQSPESDSTKDTTSKENVSANDKTSTNENASTERQQNADTKSETASKPNEQATKSKPFYERLDPNKYKRREMKVGNQNPQTMGINRIISDDEKRQLSEILGRAMEVDTIMNENYIVRLRFYNEVVKKYGGAKMDIQEFILNKHSVLESIGNKFIHRCSARGGTLYISPSIWNLLAQDECVVCMYYGKYADDFIFIESQEELMQMIDQDAIVIQVTGNDKKHIVNKVYGDDILSDLNTNGNVYTLIRTVKEDNSKLVYTSPDDIPVNSYSDEDIDPDMF